MSAKGQTINDRINAAKYTIAGQVLARCICKATTEELMRPKKKHLDYLAACTYESNVSMLQLSNMLIERTNHSNWAVVYKALITVHHLMSFGSERFTQYLASDNYSFNLTSFLDRAASKGVLPTAMSTFIRRYSNYINQKALSYRTLAVDLCRTQRGKDNILRSMPIERLLETLPVVQRQMDVLLDFGCTANDLNNSIITASFTLLFYDAIRLFASYNDGIINLFEKYFDLNKRMCREAFESYKKFLSCNDRVAEFLKVAEEINLDRGDLPDFKKAPSSLLDALEQHLTSLESSKKKLARPQNILPSDDTSDNKNDSTFAEGGIGDSFQFSTPETENNNPSVSLKTTITTNAVEQVDLSSLIPVPPKTNSDSRATKRPIGALNDLYSLNMITADDPFGLNHQVPAHNLLAEIPQNPSPSSSNPASLVSNENPATESPNLSDTRPASPQQQTSKLPDSWNYLLTGTKIKIDLDNLLRPEGKQGAAPTLNDLARNKTTNDGLIG